ncbi:MAG TPA: 2-amino-4-hydroxy-6-hydroxymethyldihydropteridine diphosphokinase [Vicinamibacterales bacterium]|nr:2-amino-4-hydroxy-6-hydroxymethyldihydropteridine diphosphokinase [Vicinamibacterales bacterium]
MRAIAVALGSNLGSRDGNIRMAAAALARILRNFRISSIIETAPVGPGLEEDPPYLNAVGVGESDLPVREIFDALRTIEQQTGRTRPYPGAPRTLDLDLILAGDEVLDDPDLQVPHPRFRDRLFVLDPLCEIAPDLVDPVTGLTIRQLRRKL